MPLRYTTCFALLVALLVASASSAAPLNRHHVPEDVKYLIHMDMRAMLNSDFGKRMVEKKREMGLEDKLWAAEQMLGLNPLYDFQGATLFGDGYEEDDATLLVYLDDDTGNLPEIARRARGHERHVYRGHTIHSYMESRGGQRQRKYAGVHEQREVNGTILIFSSDRKKVEATIDLLTGHAGQSLARAGDRVTSTAPSAGSWLFAAGDDLTELPRQDRRARMARMIQSMVLDIGEDGDKQVHMNATMTAVDADRARALRQMMEGGMAMVRLSEKPKAMTDLLDAVRIEQDGATLGVSFAYDAAKLFADLQAMKKAAQNDPEAANGEKPTPEADQRGSGQE